MQKPRVNNKKRSHTQLDSRKQVIAFQDRVITIVCENDAAHSFADIPPKQIFSVSAPPAVQSKCPAECPSKQQRPVNSEELITYMKHYMKYFEVREANEAIVRRPNNFLVVEDDQVSVENITSM